MVRAPAGKIRYEGRRKRTVPVPGEWIGDRRTRDAGGEFPRAERLVHSAELAPVFERGFTEWWLRAVTDREPVWGWFPSPR